MSANIGPPVPTSRRRLRTLAGLGVLVMAVLGLGGWLWLRPREVPPAPPEVDLAEADPEVAAVIVRARMRVAADPRSGEAWGRLGQLLRAHGYGAEANVCLAEAERLDPIEPRWPYLHGLTLVLTDPGAGVPCLERAVALCGDEPPAPRLRLAEVLLEQGRLDEAEAHLRQAQRRAPHAPRVHLEWARLALGRADWRGALEHLSSCVEDPHARKLAHALRADAWSRLGEVERAREEGKQAADLPEDVPWPDPFVLEVEALQVGVRVRLAAAGALLRQERPGEAVALLEEVVRSRPESVPAWVQLGQALLGLKENGPAERAFTEALGRAPDSVEGRFGRGCARFFLGRTRDAAEDFRRVVRLKPDHVLAHFNLGQCLKQLDDPAGAAREFHEALRCRPDHAPARTALRALEEKEHD
jgi:cytochrome c-type biogenesis protein CcmH/NrfG